MIEPRRRLQSTFMSVASTARYVDYFSGLAVAIVLVGLDSP